MPPHTQAKKRTGRKSIISIGNQKVKFEKSAKRERADAYSDQAALLNKSHNSWSLHRKRVTQAKRQSRELVSVWQRQCEVLMSLINIRDSTLFLETGS